MDFLQKVLKTVFNHRTLTNIKDNFILTIRKNLKSLGWVFKFNLAPAFLSKQAMISLQEMTDF